jgi:hypothetical protein
MLTEAEIRRERVNATLGLRAKCCFCGRQHSDGAVCWETGMEYVSKDRRDKAGSLTRAANAQSFVDWRDCPFPVLLDNGLVATEELAARFRETGDLHGLLTLGLTRGWKGVEPAELADADLAGYIRVMARGDASKFLDGLARTPGFGCEGFARLRDSMLARTDVSWEIADDWIRRAEETADWIQTKSSLVREGVIDGMIDCRLDNTGVPGAMGYVAANLGSRYDAADLVDFAHRSSGWTDDEVIAAFEAFEIRPWQCVMLQRQCRRVGVDLDFAASLEPRAHWVGMENYEVIRALRSERGNNPFFIHSMFRLMDPSAFKMAVKYIHDNKKSWDRMALRYDSRVIAEEAVARGWDCVRTLLECPKSALADDRKYAMERVGPDGPNENSLKWLLAAPKGVPRAATAKYIGCVMETHRRGVYLNDRHCSKESDMRSVGMTPEEVDEIKGRRSDRYAY